MWTYSFLWKMLTPSPEAYKQQIGNHHPFGEKREWLACSERWWEGAGVCTAVFHGFYFGFIGKSGERQRLTSIPTCVGSVKMVSPLSFWGNGDPCEFWPIQLTRCAGRQGTQNSVTGYPQVFVIPITSWGVTGLIWVLSLQALVKNAYQVRNTAGSTDALCRGMQNTTAGLWLCSQQINDIQALPQGQINICP